MRLFNRLRGGERATTTVDDYITALNSFSYGGIGYGSGITQTLSGQGVERPAQNLVGHAATMTASDVVFACMLNRQQIFSSVRFRWQQLSDGKPSRMFGTPDLRLLESPWPGGTTQDMTSRMIQDVDLAGNSFQVVEGEQVVRLRPDWVDIVVEKRIARGGQLGYRKLGYIYTEGGDVSGARPVIYAADEVAHFEPIPDPLAPFRGMSWLTPIARTVQADRQMTAHRQAFFENGATPNMVVKHQSGAQQEKILAFADALDARHTGVGNAYRTLHLYPGADATVVGKDFQQIDFRAVQGASETRIAAAAGVPPVIVGLSEGLAAATYSNYGQARRRFADGTIHPLWQNAAGSLAPLLRSPGPGTRLWYDAADVPFLREDEKDAAEIKSVQATTIRQLIDAGFTPDSAVQAVESGDYRGLVHTGLFSVQLQAPGTATSTGVVNGAA